MSRTHTILAAFVIFASSGVASAFQTPTVAPATPPPTATSQTTAPSPQTYTLKQLFKVGDVATYNSKADILLNGMALTVTAVVTQKVKATDDTSYTVDQTEGNLTLLVNNQEQPASAIAVSLSLKYSPNGLIKDLKSLDADFDYGIAFREQALDTFLVPDKPVKIGDTWSYLIPAVKDKWLATQLNFKLVGLEPVSLNTTTPTRDSAQTNATQCLRIDVTNKETTGDQPAVSQGSVWLDPMTFQIVKKVFKVTNYPIPGAPSPLNGTVTFTLKPPAASPNPANPATTSMTTGTSQTPATVAAPPQPAH
jgi:hypothetical protein